MTTPCEVFSLGNLLCDEMVARGWDTADVIRHSGSRNPARDLLVLELVLCAPVDLNFNIDDGTLDLWASAFNVSAEMFRNIHDAWRENREGRQEFSCPEDLLSGANFVTIN